MKTWAAVTASIAAAVGKPVAVNAVRPMSGGCINTAVVIETETGPYFVKLNEPSRLDMFTAEAEGLRALAATHAVRVPTPICSGVEEDQAFLVLEYLQIARLTDETQGSLGRRLAQLHRHAARRYGWHRDNTIGSTPQSNAWTDSWTEFFRDRRLRPQLERAGSEGYRRVSVRGEHLLARLHALLRDHDCAPSLLHGDLWSGNAAALPTREPVIFDPAVYYGDRETDLAMTELFGGFARAFYDAYEAEWPLAPGYEVRRALYNLYHILNHLNLFGAGYRTRAEQTIDYLLAEIG
ncbi:MAG: fructosamine kinase family protein [Sulfurifustis sp.]